MVCSGLNSDIEDMKKSSIEEDCGNAYFTQLSISFFGRVFGAILIPIIVLKMLH